jgi:hypothetical protein
MRRRADDNAGVDLANRADVLAGILLLDDAHDIAGGVANDASISGRIGHLDGQHAQALGAGGLHEALQGVDRGQRHVAVQHQRGLAVVEQRQGLHHGVAGAQLLSLLGKGNIVRANGFAHQFGAMTHHHHEPRRRQRARGIEDVG